MKSRFLPGHWAGAFLLVAFVLCIMPAAPAQAQGPAKGEGVFLILSLDGDFDPDSDDGATTLFVQIGSLEAGDTIYNTRYKKKSDVSIKLPGKYKWSQLNGNAFTVIGSFNAPTESVHLITPEESPESDPIPRKVQEAFFAASPELTAELEDAFPTTMEIAQFIYDEARRIGAETDELGNPLRLAPGPVPGIDNPSLTEWLDHDHSNGGSDTDPYEASLTADTVRQYIFQTGTDDVLDTTGDVYAEGDGDLYPHNPGARLFGFNFKIEKKKKSSKVDSDMELDVKIDIKPGNADNVIEKSDKGVVWAAILTSVSDTKKDENGNYIVTFDAATEMDGSWKTVYLGDAPATDYKIEDADHDGHKDITLKFRVNQIGISTGTTLVMLTGETDADIPMNITGSDYVTIKK